MAARAWKILPRPVMESVLNHTAMRDRIFAPLILVGPRGVGKTTLILERLLGDWNKGPHLTGYVDFARSIKDHHHPDHNQSFPWCSWSSFSAPPISNLINDLENCLESMAYKAVRQGALSSQAILSTLNKRLNPQTALRHIIDETSKGLSPTNASTRWKVSTSLLWDQAVSALSARSNAQEIDGLLELDKSGQAVSVEEASCYREAVVSLRLAKEVIKAHSGWRANAVANLNHTDGFSRSLAQSSADWPCLLLELLSGAVEVGHFQPKLVINNIEVLRNAALVDDSTVCGSQYHDILLLKMISLCDEFNCLPIVLVTSDSYYSHQALLDFGSPKLFIICENHGWTEQEATMHMHDYFTYSEWDVIARIIGSNPRHLFELYALMQSNSNQAIAGHKGQTFEEILDAYLAYLQVTAVNPAMDKALSLIQKFAQDARNGKVVSERLCFGAPWRHPPRTDDPGLSLEWARIQLMDCVQSLVNARFVLNYSADITMEFLEDPAAVSLIEVGMLYVLHKPYYIRPSSPAIKRCLVRWLIQERLKMGSWSYVQYLWQRFVRGRSYRHLICLIDRKANRELFRRP